MTDNPYYSPSQVSLFVNGYHIDDAVGIQWNIVDDKTPVFGYADRFMRTTMTGKSIVQGSLEIHFRFHGYLTNVIETIQTEDPLGPKAYFDWRKSTHKNNVDENMELFKRTYAPDQKAAEIANLFAPLAGLTLDSTPRDVFQSIKNTFWSPTDPLTSHPAKERPGLHPKSFDILVSYGGAATEYNRLVNMLIEGVRIVGQSTVISADVPEAGAPLREAYSFVARTIRPYRQ